MVNRLTALMIEREHPPPPPSEWSDPEQSRDNGQVWRSQNNIIHTFLPYSTANAEILCKVERSPEALLTLDATLPRFRFQREWTHRHFS